MITTNPSTHRGVADWSQRNSLLAYGSGNLVYISEIEQNCCSLRGHSGPVTAVKWMDRADCCELVTASVDGSIIQWRAKGDPRDFHSWSKVQQYSGVFKEAIELLSVLQSPDGINLLAYSMEGKLVYWGLEETGLNSLATLNFGNALQESIGLCYVNEAYTLVVIGGFTNVIHLYLFDKKAKTLDFKCSITGHHNSVRDLSFIKMSATEILLASGSMDGLIRIWKIRAIPKEEMKETGVLEGADVPDLHEQYKSKTSYIFESQPGEYFNVVLESVLSYHTEGINSLCWNTDLGYLRLLSASNDGSSCLWEASSEAGGAWNVVSTFGEMTAGSRNAVYQALFCGPSQILSYSYNGCFSRYMYSESLKKWEQKIALTGHFGSVNDIIWDPSEQFLISCSSDMQTKIYSCLKTEGCANQKWFEISRPQIHGYEVNSIVVFPSFPSSSKDQNSPFQILSGADEKVIRLFDPPYAFMKAGNALSKADIKYSQKMTNEEYEASVGKREAAGASITQPLTLMNKAVPVSGEAEEEAAPYNFDPDTFLSNKNIEADSKMLMKTEPPLDYFLSNFGLWPEAQKLYGHAHEIQTLAISPDYKYVASCAKANKMQDAAIIIWSLSTFKPIAKLPGHSLSITQMEFSKDGQRLLSVGRDRQWILYGDFKDKFEIICKKPEAHGRVIYACSWAPDSQMFATASRDKKESVKFWVFKDEWIVDSFLSDIHNVTAIRFFPRSSSRILTGTESGDLSLWEKIDKDWKCQLVVHPNLCHGATITRILITSDPASPEEYLAATASQDRSLRLLKFMKK